MKYFRKLATLLISGMLFFSLSVQGEAAGELIKAINAIRASLDAIVNTVATYLFQTPSNVGNELVTNHTLHNIARGTVAPNIAQHNRRDILEGLTPQPQNPNENLVKLAVIQASDTVLPSAGVPTPLFSQPQSNAQANLAKGNENFNFQSLYSPLVYNTPDLENYALNYIRFISGFGTLISSFNLNSFPETQLSIKQKLTIQESGNYQNYMVQRRQLLALQSGLLSNLYWIYARRLPINSIKAGDTALGVDHPSVAQIEDYNATWRTKSSTWYTQMATASPSNVERETLYVLAEIRSALHQLHEDNERLIALAVLNQLNTLQVAKQSLALTEKQVLDTINQLIKSTAEQSLQNNTPEQSTQASQLKEAQTITPKPSPPR
jgi:hypothetical protein